ncbi:radial spoke head protein 6 homolog A-like [Cyprinus carpio]|uniref:Radial spoke head protein 6 homolog A-like n=1 Tax=Cyprinus carpio TaxID=7962 RepID=A0A9Q9WCC6_CYPCA|nr:radial spoke head protein 6 homolog A-like [Cyprinus carpio]
MGPSYTAYTYTVFHRCAALSGLDRMLMLVAGSLETYTIGWGIKYIGEAFFHHPKMGNPSGPEITEALDPSVKEEDETEDLEDEEEED